MQQMIFSGNAVSHAKLLQLIILFRHMINLIMELIHNCSFTLTTVTGLKGQLRQLRNNFPEGSVLSSSCSFLHLYINDLPTGIAKELIVVEVNFIFV